MRERNDRVGEEAAGGDRSGAGCWAPCAGDAAATPRVVQDHRSSTRRSVREVAVALVQARPDFGNVARRPRAVPFRRHPEEGPILHHRAANAPAVQPVIGIGQPALFLRDAGDGVEEVFRLTPHRTGLVETAAVKVVASGARRDVEHAAAGATHLGVVGVDLHFHVLERLDRRVEDRAAPQLSDRHAIDQIVIRADAAAAD